MNVDFDGQKLGQILILCVLLFALCAKFDHERKKKGIPTVGKLILNNENGHTMRRHAKLLLNYDSNYHLFTPKPDVKLEKFSQKALKSHRNYKTT